MKTTRISASNIESARTHASNGWLLWFVLTLVALLPASSQAYILSWDGNTNLAISDGSGNWVSSQWWDGTNDVAWVNTSSAAVVTNIIGSTNPGTYNIVMNSPAVTAVSMFRSNNYTISGTSALTVSNSISLSPGANTTISCPIIGGSGGAGVTFSNNTVLTEGGGFSSLGGNPNFNGTSSQTLSTLNITNGTYTAGGTETYNNVTVNQTGGAVAYAIWNIGRTSAATYNLSGGTLRSTTVNAWSISRGFPAIVNVSGTAILGPPGFVNVASTTATDNGTLNVLGGTVNIGSGLAATPGVTAASLGTLNLLALGAAGTYSSKSRAVVNISGGITTAKGIVFGSSVSSYVSNPPCIFNVTGGSL
jgi:hypothetical protein